ncbi:glutathione peroxidase [Ferrimonas balearica]|uniref:glutathione peroxidase n=1 Tax=Ferrimonas balearica TaxID=44012 RepID=UPI001C98EF6A|nr:glutathione peroxidase [Ferrimonas balearica]MBY5993528.1 glutathione peroxidase [Ferrimonas balearica]
MFRTLPLLLALSAPALAQCPDWLDTEKRRLHSKEQVDLCALTADKAVLLVNTASHCGFTPQFKQLEALHQTYGPQGLVIIGMPSDDFFQEADDEAETADVCYRNYGVSFTMLTPASVRGSDADPLFAELARQGGAPKWNFYKYLVDQQGNLVEYWSPKTDPDDPEITDAIEKLLNGS